MLVLARSHRADVLAFVAEHFSRGERAALAIRVSHLDQLARLHALFKLRFCTSANVASPIERFSASRISSRSSATASRSRFALARVGQRRFDVLRFCSGSCCCCSCAPAPRASRAPAAGRTLPPSPGAAPAFLRARATAALSSRVWCAAICAAPAPLKPCSARCSRICWLRGLDASRYSRV